MDPRAITLGAWQAVHGTDPSDDQLSYTMAIARLENNFGRAGQFAAFAADGDYNWGSLHANARPPCPDGSRQGSDQGNVCFKVFGSDEAAAKAFVYELTANPHFGRQNVAAAMDGGSPEDVAQAMKGAKYFTAPTATYASAIRSNLAALGADVPDGGGGGSSSFGRFAVVAGLLGAGAWYVQKHGWPRWLLKGL